MVNADAFVAEVEFKNQESFRSLVASGYLPVLAGDGASIADMLRLETKFVIESIEAAAIWIADTESLEMKIVLGLQCGIHASHYQKLQERLSELGLAPGSYDPRQGGYSKLYAFLRSLQTSEERVATGLLTLGGAALARLQSLAAFCDDKGDVVSGDVLRRAMIPNEQQRMDEGREKLVQLATSEDSQARARRAIFKTVELLGEALEPGSIRRTIGRTARR
jgi:hypothetical protein